MKAREDYHRSRYLYRYLRGLVLSTLCHEQKRALFERKQNENVRTGEIRSILFPRTLEFTQEVVRINKCAGHSSATV